ncbi:MAG: hypothetical protein AAF518_11900 [Spirochaetota bacterium]
MGILGDNVKKMHDKQKQSLIKEAAKAQLSIVEVVDIGSEQEGGKKAVSSTLKAVFGGKLAPDFFQVFLFGQEYLYIQPYSGITVLPGEHHKICQGSFSEALALTDEAIFSGPSWRSDSNKQLNKEIGQNYPALKKISKKTEFEWAIGMGKITLEWGAQLFSLGNGTSHVVLQTGRYGGFTTYEVGFSHFQKLSNEIQKVLSNSETAYQEALYSISYLPLANSFFAGEEEGETTQEYEEMTEEEVPAAASIAETIDRDFAEIIAKSAKKFVGKKVFVGDFPAKKENNARKYAMSGSPEKIVALFDLTVFGSAKDAIVLSEERCYIRDIEDPYTIAYEDVVSVGKVLGSLEDKLEIHLKGSTLEIPVGDHAKAVRAVFRAIAGSS